MADHSAGIELIITTTEDGDRYKLQFTNDDNFVETLDVTELVYPVATGVVHGGEGETALMLVFEASAIKREDERRPACAHPKWPNAESTYCAISMSCPNYAGKFLLKAK